MKAESQMSIAPAISGNMIDLGAGHSIAIYERDRASYVAEFRDGHGDFEYADTWFRFRSGVLRYSPIGRASMDSATPLSLEMVRKIERLHAASEARQKRILALPRNVFEAARRYLISVMSRLRSRTKISQTIA